MGLLDTMKQEEGQQRKPAIDEHDDTDLRSREVVPAAT